MKRFSRTALGTLLATIGVLLPSLVTALELALPIVCPAGCPIQNYVDVEPTSRAQDYQCARLTYDGHKGTDFRLANLREMEQGVRVVAAASGTVRAIRDGMADISIRDSKAPSIAGREAGNAVALSHPGGWETRYAHLRKGSVAVKVGQTVKVGTVLGYVGLSGKTEFPHLHFSVWHGDDVVDPFSGMERYGRKCGLSQGPGLWTTEAFRALSYRRTQPLQSGFASEAPTYPRIRTGNYDQVSFSNNAPVLAFWVEVIGTYAGQRETMEMFYPDGTPVAKSERTLDKNQVSAYRFVGKRARGKRWPSGEYIGRYRLANSKGDTLVDLIRRLRVR